MDKVKNIGVLGSGSWGTAMIKMLTENSSNILWYVRDNVQAEQIIRTKRNPKYLKELEINIDKVFIILCLFILFINFINLSCVIKN